MAGIGIILIGIVLMWFAFTFRQKIKSISKNGKEVEGVIFDIVQDSTPRSEARNPVVRFVTIRQEWITEKYTLFVFPGLLKQGKKVTVIYNTNNPKEFFLKSPINSIVPTVANALAILLFATGIYKLLHI